MDGDGAPSPPPGDDSAGRGRKRNLDEADMATEARITPGRLAALTTLVARTFARQSEPDMPRIDLLDAVNAGLVEGEAPFSEDEFASGLDELERQNKIMRVETGNVVHVG